MQTTSHFIGITVKSTVFTKLFNKLQQYLRKNNAEPAITLLTMKSIHITLYYFEKDIPATDLLQIKQTLDALRIVHTNLMITTDHLKFFQKDKKDVLGYLSPVQKAVVCSIHDQLAVQYKRNFIPDNNYAYIPHISLFTITNTHVFNQHKAAIKTIIQTALATLSQENIFDSFALFTVDSNITPEVQVPMTL